MTTANRSNRRGFTLVELLVVIGIIALLISMLLPSLTRVRGQAQSAACKAQMRDVGLSLNLYSQTYRGWLYPVGEFRASSSVPRSTPPTIPAGTPDPDTFPMTARQGPSAAPAAATASPQQSASSAAAAPPAPTVTGFFDTLGIEPEWDKAYPASKYNVNGQYYRGRFLRWPNYAFEPACWNPRVLICPADDQPAEQHTYILNRHLSKNIDKVVKFGTGLPGHSPSEILLMGEKKTLVEDYYMGAKENDPTATEFDIVEPYRHGLRLGSNYLYMDGHVELLPPAAVQNAMDAWDPGQ